MNEQTKVTTHCFNNRSYLRARGTRRSITSEHDSTEEYSDDFNTGILNSDLSEPEKRRLFLLNSLERHFHAFERRLLQYAFMELQECHEDHLRRKIATIMLYRHIKIFNENLKEIAFDLLKQHVGKSQRASQSMRKYSKDEQSAKKIKDSKPFDVLASYLQETAPIKPLLKSDIDRAFSARRLLNRLQYVFREARTKRYAFNTLKAPLVFASYQQPQQTGSNSSVRTAAVEKSTKSRNYSDPKQERLLIGIKKLSDYFYKQEVKAFAVLRDKLLPPRERVVKSKADKKHNLHIAKISRFFSYRQNRKLKSVDYSLMNYYKGTLGSQARGASKDDENVLAQASASPRPSSLGSSSQRNLDANQRVTSSDGKENFPLSSSVGKRVPASLKASEFDEDRGTANEKAEGKDSEAIRLSEREQLIKEKLKKVVMKPAPAFKEKQIERYLRYEHTFYQVLRVFKGALKRELYYSFENLKNWGNLDPRIHQKFVKIMNRSTGRMQQDLHRVLATWRDNARRRHLALMTLRNFISILNLKKNLVLENSFVHLQLVCWFNSEKAREQLSNKKSRLNASDEVPIAWRGAGLIIQKGIKSKLNENLMHAFRTLRQFADKKFKQGMQIEQGANKLLSSMLRQGGSQFLQNLKDLGMAGRNEKISTSSESDSENDESQKDKNQQEREEAELKGKDQSGDKIRGSKVVRTSLDSGMGVIKEMENEDQDVKPLKEAGGIEKISLISPIKLMMSKKSEPRNSYIVVDGPSNRSILKLGFLKSLARTAETSGFPLPKTSETVEKETMRDASENSGANREEERSASESGSPTKGNLLKREEYSERLETSGAEKGENSSDSNKQEGGGNKNERSRIPFEDRIRSAPNFLSSSGKLSGARTLEKDSLISQIKEKSHKNQDVEYSSLHSLNKDESPPKSQNLENSFDASDTRKAQTLTDSLLMRSGKSPSRETGSYSPTVISKRKDDSNADRITETDHTELRVDANDSRPTTQSNSKQMTDQQQTARESDSISSKSPTKQKADFDSERIIEGSNVEFKAFREGPDQSAIDEKSKLKTQVLTGTDSSLIKSDRSPLREFDSYSPTTENKQRDDADAERVTKEDSMELKTPGAQTAQSMINQKSKQKTHSREPEKSVDDAEAVENKSPKLRPFTESDMLKQQSHFRHSEGDKRSYLSSEPFNNETNETQNVSKYNKDSGISEINQRKLNGGLYMMKSLDLLFKFKRKFNLSSAFHDIKNFSQRNSVEDLQRSFSNQFSDAKRKQNSEVFGKVLESVLRPLRFRHISWAFGLLKAFNERQLHMQNVKAIKLKNIIKKRHIMNLSYAFNLWKTDFELRRREFLIMSNIMSKGRAAGERQSQSFLYDNGDPEENQQRMLSSSLFIPKTDSNGTGSDPQRKNMDLNLSDIRRDDNSPLRRKGSLAESKVLQKGPRTPGNDGKGEYFVESQAQSPEERQSYTHEEIHSPFIRESSSFDQAASRPSNLAKTNPESGTEQGKDDFPVATLRLSRVQQQQQNSEKNFEKNGGSSEIGHVGRQTPVASPLKSDTKQIFPIERPSSQEFIIEGKSPKNSIAKQTSNISDTSDIFRREVPPVVESDGDSPLQAREKGPFSIENSDHDNIHSGKQSSEKEAAKNTSSLPYAAENEAWSYGGRSQEDRISLANRLEGKSQQNESSSAREQQICRRIEQPASLDQEIDEESKNMNIPRGNITGSNKNLLAQYLKHKKAIDKPVSQGGTDDQAAHMNQPNNSKLDEQATINQSQREYIGGQRKNNMSQQEGTSQIITLGSTAKPPRDSDRDQLIRNIGQYSKVEGKIQHKEEKVHSDDERRENEISNLQSQQNSDLLQSPEKQEISIFSKRPERTHDEYEIKPPSVLKRIKPAYNNGVSNTRDEADHFHKLENNHRIEEFGYQNANKDLQSPQKHQRLQDRGSSLNSSEETENKKSPSSQQLNAEQQGYYENQANSVKQQGSGEIDGPNLEQDNLGRYKYSYVSPDPTHRDKMSEISSQTRSLKNEEFERLTQPKSPQTQHNFTPNNPERPEGKEWTKKHYPSFSNQNEFFVNPSNAQETAQPSQLSSLPNEKSQEGTEVKNRDSRIREFDKIAADFQPIKDEGTTPSFILRKDANSLQETEKSRGQNNSSPKESPQKISSQPEDDRRDVFQGSTQVSGRSFEGSRVKPGERSPLISDLSQGELPRKDASNKQESSLTFKSDRFNQNPTPDFASEEKDRLSGSEKNTERIFETSQAGKDKDSSVVIRVKEDGSLGNSPSKSPQNLFENLQNNKRTMDPLVPKQNDEEFIQSESKSPGKREFSEYSVELKQRENSLSKLSKNYQKIEDFIPNRHQFELFSQRKPAEMGTLLNDNRELFPKSKSSPKKTIQDFPDDLQSKKANQFSQEINDEQQADVEKPKTSGIQENSSYLTKQNQVVSRSMDESPLIRSEAQQNLITPNLMNQHDEGSYIKSADKLHQDSIRPERLSENSRIQETSKYPTENDQKSYTQNGFLQTKLSQSSKKPENHTSQSGENDAERSTGDISAFKDAIKSEILNNKEKTENLQRDTIPEFSNKQLYKALVSKNLPRKLKDSNIHPEEVTIIEPSANSAKAIEKSTPISAATVKRSQLFRPPENNEKSYLHILTNKPIDIKDETSKSPTADLYENSNTVQQKEVTEPIIQSSKIIGSSTRKPQGNTFLLENSEQDSLPGDKNLLVQNLKSHPQSNLLNQKPSNLNDGIFKPGPKNGGEKGELLTNEKPSMQFDEGEASNLLRRSNLQVDSSFFEPAESYYRYPSNPENEDRPYRIDGSLAKKDLHQKSLPLTEDRGQGQNRDSDELIFRDKSMASSNNLSQPKSNDSGRLSKQKIRPEHLQYEINSGEKRIPGREDYLQEEFKTPQDQSKTETDDLFIHSQPIFSHGKKAHTKKNPKGANNLSEHAPNSWIQPEESRKSNLRQLSELDKLNYPKKANSQVLNSTQRDPAPEDTSARVDRVKNFPMKKKPRHEFEDTVYHSNHPAIKEPISDLGDDENLSIQIKRKPKVTNKDTNNSKSLESVNNDNIGKRLDETAQFLFSPKKAIPNNKAGEFKRFVEPIEDDVNKMPNSRESIHQRPSSYWGPKSSQQRSQRLNSPDNNDENQLPEWIRNSSEPRPLSANDPEYHVARPNPSIDKNHIETRDSSYLNYSKFLTSNKPPQEESFDSTRSNQNKILSLNEIDQKLFKYGKGCKLQDFIHSDNEQSPKKGMNEQRDFIDPDDLFDKKVAQRAESIRLGLRTPSYFQHEQNSRRNSHGSARSLAGAIPIQSPQNKVLSQILGHPSFTPEGYSAPFGNTFSVNVDILSEYRRQSSLFGETLRSERSLRGSLGSGILAGQINDTNHSQRLNSSMDPIVSPGSNHMRESLSTKPLAEIRKSAERRSQPSHSHVAGESRSYGNSYAEPLKTRQESDQKSFEKTRVSEPPKSIVQSTRLQVKDLSLFEAKDNHHLSKSAL